MNEKIFSASSFRKQTKLLFSFLFYRVRYCKCLQSIVAYRYKQNMSMLFTEYANVIYRYFLPNRPFDHLNALYFKFRYFPLSTIKF